MGLPRFFVSGLAGVLMLHGLHAQSEVSWVGALPELVPESSGLLLVGNRLVTHNDSGNSPELYVLDTTSLEVVRRVRITNAENTDWEDLAQDEEFIYIGDIGNNLGSRRDLKVLRISREAFLRSDAVEASVISYSYEDQSDFGGSQNSDWDAEALLPGADSLYIFTKQWQSGNTVAYRIPKTPGHYQALRTAEYPAGGLVTGASPIPGQEAFLLLGYTGQLQPYLLRISSKRPDAGGAEPIAKMQLDIPFGQAEGVAALPSGVIYLSTEAFSNRLVSLPAGIFRYTPGGVSQEGSENGDPGRQGQGPGDGDGGQKLLLYQAPGSHTIRYQVPGKSRITAKAIFDTSGRRVWFAAGEENLPGEMDVSGLRNAVYYLTVYLPEQRLTKAFLRY